MTTKLHLALAGSTTHSVSCGQALQQNPNFSVDWVVAPQPKKIGRKQILTANPVHNWADKQAIKTFSIKNNLDELKPELIQQQLDNPIDYLLVVDFGYFMPNWLLALPNKAVLNLHPSALPEWRGSSPGQFVILFAQQTSAITLMRLINKLDAGPIIAQEKFSVEDNWTSVDYYQHSFKLAQQQLADWILAYDQGELSERAQPDLSPTPQAKKINKQDAGVPWAILQKLISTNDTTLADLVPMLNSINLLEKILKTNSTTMWSQLITRACRAFQPWPVLWTEIPTTKGNKKMQILDCKVDALGKLQLQQVKIEGQQQAQWNQVKNTIIFEE